MQNCTIKTKGLIGKMGLEEQKEKKNQRHIKKKHMKKPCGGKELNMTTGGLCDWMAEHERNAAQYEASM